MRNANFCNAVSAAVALTLWGVACSRTTPTSPTGPSSPTLSVMRVMISAPDSVAPGETVQLIATAMLSDGTTRVVTDEATWESSNSGLISISRTGLVTAGQSRGEAEITAKYTGRLPAASTGGSDSRKLFVLPAGTYVLTGSVKDGDVPLSGAEIELTAGLRAAMAVTSDPSFRFYGVAGDTEIRASKAGYETQVRRILVTANQTTDFDLIPSDPRPVVGGTYTLRVVAAAECRDRLPGTALARAYAAVVSQTGAQLQVMLTGANLQSPYGPSNTFSGFAEPNRALFTLASYFSDTAGTFSPPSVVELLTPPNTYFTFFGSVVITPDENGYSGTLDGNIEVLTLSGPWDYGDAYTRLAYCRSTGHQFMLIR